MLAKELSVLMISLDPGFYDVKAASGNVIDRHKKYASRIKSLDIIVLGGWKHETVKLENLNLHITGIKGVGNFSKAKQIGLAISKLKKIDIIVTQDPHVTGWIGLKLKKILKVPLGVHFHGDFWNNHHWKKEQWKNVIYDWMQKKVVAKADLIRVVSYGIMAKLIESGIEASKIEVINTPLNDKLFSRLSSEQQVLLEELRYKYRHRQVILFVGRLAAAKNLFFILDVIEEIRKRREKILLLVIGDGVQMNDVKSHIDKNNLDSSIKLLENKSQADLVIYYSLAEVLLLLSTNESFGKVIIEAGLTGTPTLASATTGAKHIVADGRSGFLVPVNDLVATVDVLEEMLEYPEHTKKLGKWAKELYTDLYSEAQTIKKIINFWLKLATNETINDNEESRS